MMLSLIGLGILYVIGGIMALMVVVCIAFTILETIMMEGRGKSMIYNDDEIDQKLRRPYSHYAPTDKRPYKIRRTKSGWEIY